MRFKPYCINIEQVRIENIRWLPQEHFLCFSQKTMKCPTHFLALSLLITIVTKPPRRSFRQIKPVASSVAFRDELEAVVNVFEKKLVSSKEMLRRKKHQETLDMTENTRNVGQMRYPVLKVNHPTSGVMVIHETVWRQIIYDAR